MHWTQAFDFFLFDFDGLLVNTEELHYLAYKKMCEDRGVALTWDFNRYCNAAHYRAEAVREQIFLEFPDLYHQEPNWDVLYAEKKRNILNLLHEDAVHPMPGVVDLLQRLDTQNSKRCVVTHSSSELIELAKAKNPILNTIPHWVTRESYSTPKPDPECYKTAIRLFASPTDRIIGFEDTPRGMEALLGVPRIKPVLICTANYPEIPTFISKGASHFKSFADITLNDL